MRNAAIAALLWVAVSALTPAALGATPSSTITFPGREIHGLAYDSWVLWAVHSSAGDADHSVITALNPITGVTIAQSSELEWNARGVCYAQGSLWIADALNDVVHQVDPTDFHEITQFATPGSEPCGITFDGTDLWLSDPNAQAVHRLSTSGVMLGSFPIPDAFRTGLEWDGAGLWTEEDSTTVIRYTTDGVVDSTQPFGMLPASSRVFDVALHDGTWYVSSGGSIHVFAGPQAVIAMTGRQVLGLACDAGRLWVTHSPLGDSDHGAITALDPATGVSLAQSVEFGWNPRGICVAEGSLWIADARNDVVHQVDPTDFHEIAQFATPGSEPCGITFDGTDLWLSDPSAKKVYRLSTIGTVLGSFPIPNAFRTGLEWDGVGLWTESDYTTASRYTTGGAVDTSRTFAPLPADSRIIDLAMNADTWYASVGSRIYVFSRPQAAVTLAGRQVLGLTCDSHVLWATHSPMGDSNHGRISALSPTTGAILRESGDESWNPRGICVADGSLWIADARGDVIRRIDPTDFHEIGQFPAPGSEPSGITFDGTNLWLSDPHAQKVYQLSLAGSVLGSFDIPDEFRTGLEWDGAGLWTETDSVVISHYSTSGGIDATYEFGTLPAGARIIDVATTEGAWFASSGDRIYMVLPDQLPTLAVGDPGAGSPTARPALSLLGPNPTRQGEGIAYTLPRDTEVRLEIVDVMGRSCVVLRQGIAAAGNHTAHWDGRDRSGARPSPGVYFVCLRTGQDVCVRRLVVLQ